jgi:hypothetical protein
VPAVRVKIRHIGAAQPAGRQAPAAVEFLFRQPDYEVCIHVRRWWPRRGESVAAIHQHGRTAYRRLYCAIGPRVAVGADKGVGCVLQSSARIASASRGIEPPPLQEVRVR